MEAMEPLRETLNEELSMAKWLDDNLEDLTAQFVTRFATGETAKQ